jgi:hypothetical protein
MLSILWNVFFKMFTQLVSPTPEAVDDYTFSDGKTIFDKFGENGEKYFSVSNELKYDVPLWVNPFANGDVTFHALVKEFCQEPYNEIITGGTHLAPSIKVAESAKVIENSQRDINIAFMNELSMIFDKIGINTYEVLEAAGTKWNFLKFYPGLVGGHCIGVDPYYLTYKSMKFGHHAQIINMQTARGNIRCHQNANKPIAKIERLDSNFSLYCSDRR